MIPLIYIFFLKKRENSGVKGVSCHQIRNLQTDWQIPEISQSTLTIMNYLNSVSCKNFKEGSLEG